MVKKLYLKPEVLENGDIKVTASDRDSTAYLDSLSNSVILLNGGVEGKIKLNNIQYTDNSFILPLSLFTENGFVQGNYNLTIIAEGFDDMTLDDVMLNTSIDKNIIKAPKADAVYIETDKEINFYNGYKVPEINYKACALYGNDKKEITSSVNIRLINSVQTNEISFVSKDKALSIISSVKDDELVFTFDGTKRYDFLDKLYLIKLDGQYDGNITLNNRGYKHKW